MSSFNVTWNNMAVHTAISLSWCLPAFLLPPAWTIFQCCRRNGWNFQLHTEGHLTNLYFIYPHIRHTSGNSGTNSLSLTQHWCHIWWAWAITNRTITREDPRTLAVLQVKGGTPGGGTLVMTLGESVECRCTTDFTCLIMEMRYGGELYSFFVFIFSFVSIPRR